jgi:hypothetical protein
MVSKMTKIKGEIFASTATLYGKTYLLISTEKLGIIELVEPSQTSDGGYERLNALAQYINKDKRKR